MKDILPTTEEAWSMKNIKIMIIGFIMLYISFDVFFSIIKCRNNNRSILLHIEGNVKQVKYNMKRTPTIKVEDSEFSLHSFYVKDRDSIFVGDSIYKRSGDDVLYHFKQNLHREHYLFDTHTLYYPWYNSLLCECLYPESRSTLNNS